LPDARVSKSLSGRLRERVQHHHLTSDSHFLFLWTVGRELRTIFGRNLTFRHLRKIVGV
jgi:hypothetical protein